MSKPSAFNYGDYVELQEKYSSLEERHEHALTILRQAGLINRMETDCTQPSCSSNCRYLEDIAANTLCMAETLDQLLTYLTNPFDN